MKQHAEIFLKSGASFRIDYKSITSGNDGLLSDGSISSLRWAAPDNWAHKLLDVDLNELAAIVLHREETPPVAPGGVETAALVAAAIAFVDTPEGCDGGTYEDLEAAVASYKAVTR